MTELKRFHVRVTYVMPQPAASFMDIRATDPESAKGMALEMTQSAIENGSRFRVSDVTEICK